MTILGISAFYHDSAACLVVDGNVVAAAQEERFTRIRHDNSFPYQAIRFCMDHGRVGPDGIDRVAFYEKPLIKFERILQNAVDIAPAGMAAFAAGMPSWFTEKLRLPRVLKRELGYVGPVEYVGHHESHAASAFLASPFQDAAIITVDGVGEWATNTIGVGHGSTIRILKELCYPHSIGLVYSAFTEFLGFKVNSDEYKVMGLAPYGEPRFAGMILDNLVDVASDGSYRLNLSHLSFRSGRTTAGAGLGKLLGCDRRKPESEIGQVHMDIARSIQAVTELVMVRQAAYARQLTGLDSLCLAGGVALNCVANGRILSGGLFSDIWIQPAAGDAGGALGAALTSWYRTSGAVREPHPDDSMHGSLLGPEYDDDTVQKALMDGGLKVEHCGDAIFDRIAQRLADGQVVARFASRMEYGPRALGSRSILADPRNPAMQRTVNEKIKFREGFRPFAPAVLEDDCADWFDLRQPSPYMLLVSQVAASRMNPAGDPEPAGLDRLKVVRSQIPAVTHVDGSARIQTVSAARAPDFTRVIDAFRRHTGCPVVLNTSFNLRGQPIVCTPSEAVSTFLACDIDALAAGPFMATKPDGWTRQALPAVKPFRRPRRPAELRRFGIENGLFFLAVGILTWFVPATPLAWLSAPAWSLAAIALGLSVAAPGRLAGIESVMNRAGARMNSVVGIVLFALVHLLVATPTGLIRRFGRKKEQPADSFWADRDDDGNSGGPENMY